MPAEKKGLRQLFNRLFAEKTPRRSSWQVRAAFSETENEFLAGARHFGETNRDRLGADREEILALALEAWRVNPLARRVVGLTSQYVVGGGIQIDCDHIQTARFMNTFWHDRLNRMPARVYEWCDELTRSGDLFVQISTDRAGMSYVRAVPSQDIDRITTRPNDVEQAVTFTVKAGPTTLAPQTWPAYSAAGDGPGEDGSFPVVMLHYAINKPVGGLWGESDLAPLLKWLSRYASWLDDRARLNRFRNAFLFVVKARFTSEGERLARQNTLAANPPTPGSILVTDENEEWSVLAPQLNPSDANTDGLALKKMIASGAGVPLHFLAEPEGATRTTAEAAGGPTYRHFEQRQNFFCWLIADVLQVVLARRAMVDRKVRRNARIHVTGGDISARDNASLSIAANNVANVFSILHDKGLISDGELLRLVYRFAGEMLDIAGDEVGKGHTGKQPHTVSSQPGKPLGTNSIDMETGEEKKQAS